MERIPLFSHKDLILSDEIKDSLIKIEPFARKGSLSLERWNSTVLQIPHSGIVTLPLSLTYHQFRNPFYFVFEKVSDEEMLFIKPIKGDPYRVGDVYGFFGFSFFENYNGEPIFLVEGIADWGAVKPFYKWTLCTLTAGLSIKQMFFLKNLTNSLGIGFDADTAGDNAYNEIKNSNRIKGIKIDRIIPLEKDWGKMNENPYTRSLIKNQIELWLQK